MTDLPDEETTRVRRTRSAAPVPDVATEPAGDTEPARRRSTYVVGGEQTDGSTIIGRRESRRRAERFHSAPPLADPVPSPAPASEGRVAVAPDGAPEVYGARSAEPVVVSRVAPPQRAAQVPVDGAATDAAHRHRARRSALIVVLAASAVVLAAAASLIALTLNL